MTIARFEFEDLRTGWKLEPVTFGGFNLLVGLSGAGKTSIVKALEGVRFAGLGRWEIHQAPAWQDRMPHTQWSLELREGEHVYSWRVRTTPLTEGGNMFSGPWMQFHDERIDCNGEPIVRRSGDGFVFRDGTLPRLNDTESAISLLKAEPDIAPLYRALERMLFSTCSDGGEMLLRQWMNDGVLRAAESDIMVLRAMMDIPVLIKAFYARTYHPPSFTRVREQYMAIFPHVTDVTVARKSAFYLEDERTSGEALSRSRMIVQGIKEHGSDEWILGEDISLGMRRTFLHLAQVELSPRGTTIIVDEYENSMGINCLPAVTDAFLERQPDIQFILTSHHPYVINNVPIDWWRVVTREGSTVRVREARDIPELDTKSHQDAFTLLTNSSVFEAGVP